MDKYSGEKEELRFYQLMLNQKNLELGVPARTTKEQWDVINNFIKNASSENIKVNITIIEE
ncbi:MULTISPECIES: hypothetical protein [Proteus]|uniref:endonuclease toxin domain-containing protein n=1 Tax=Proteus TaxID=583 RepID=UPI0034D48680